jgi:hypothetical protein
MRDGHHRKERSLHIFYCYVCILCLDKVFFTELLFTNDTYTGAQIHGGIHDLEVEVTLRLSG